jgi:hypothetical protein
LVEITTDGVNTMGDLINVTSPTLKIMVFGVCFAGFIVGAVLLNSTKDRRATAPTAVDPVPGAATPPMDAAAPAHTETATFALG